MDLRVIDAVDGSTFADVISAVAAQLEPRGLVTTSWAEAVVERENRFPTALPFEGGPIGIPHANAEHSRGSALVLARMTRPIPVYAMGTSAAMSEPLEVSTFLVVSVESPEMHLDTLTRLMRGLHDPERRAHLHGAPPAEALAALTHLAGE